MALISVVIPAYNAAATLSETLDSVLQQTYSNLEIWIVDDGSTDSTLNVARRFAQLDSRVKIIAQANGGVAAARNTAIATAKGEWVATIDADDLWHPRKLELQLSEANRTSPSPALIYAWSRRIDDNSYVISDMGTPWHAGFAFEQLLTTNFIRNASSAMIRREAILQVGGFDPKLRERGCQGAEDIKLYLAIAEKHILGVCQHFLTGYRARSDSMSQDSNQMRESLEIVLRDVQARHPSLPGELIKLARTNYDLYAASIAGASRDWKSFARYLRNGVRRRPIDAAFLLGCMGIWLVVERSTRKKDRPSFYSLNSREEFGMPLSQSLEAFQTRAARRASGSGNATKHLPQGPK